MLFGPTKLNYEDDSILDDENDLGEEFIKPGYLTLLDFEEKGEEKPKKEEKKEK